MESEEGSIQLPGYSVGSVRSHSSGRVVFSAIRLTDNAKVAIETLDTDYPSRQQAAIIRHGGVIAQRLTAVDGVCNVHEIIPYGSGNIALVTDCYETTLSSHLAYTASEGLPTEQVLDIALRLIKILSQIHSQDIIHKSLMPANILFDTATGDIAITGFDIASELENERQAMQMSRHIEGPLPYISPEQTGRLNRSLDYRSDYYSLGILLFELLTGKLPFEADNPLEWVYAHISRLPPSAHALCPDVPERVAAIILKLMSKDPESRYQSTQGLLHDLNVCASQLAANRKIEHFELGQRDIGQKFLVPQKLYGRERELQTLHRLFESAVAGGNEFCLIHGYSGVGKTALVNEMDIPLVRQRGFLVQGKFQQFQQSEAYTAIAATFRGLVQQILAKPEDELAQWRNQLIDALTPNAQLVINLVPELSLIMGEQPEVIELPPAEARNRLHIVLTAFLNVFAGPEHPVVLFLDDIQWSDAPTLELLRKFVTSHELSHLLLIGAYRSNEISAGHPLSLLIDTLNTHKNLHQLPLTPLEPDSVNQLVTDSLHCTPHEAKPLSDMLFVKAQGNPFFTNELLRQLHKQGSLLFDAETTRWSFNPNTADRSEISSDVIEFMVDNLRKLPPSTQHVLQLAACIGNSFDLKTLSTIYQQSADETANTLLPALKQHTVLPLNNDYRLVGNKADNVFNPSYRFQHDRIQQAAHALIPPQQLADVHLSIGRLMLSHVSDTVSDNHLIDIVGHFNEGRKLIQSAQERQFLAELNLRAGIRARESSAYEAALGYLTIAESLLPAEPWQVLPDFMQSLATEMQQCAYLTGRIEDAEKWINSLLEHASSELERSNILATRTRQYATLGRMEDSIFSAIQGLALLGVDFTDNPSNEDIAFERLMVTKNLDGRHIADLVNAELVQAPATLTAMRLLMEIFAAAFLSGSGNLFPYLILKSVNLSLRYGNCPESAFAYAAYGMLLCGELDEPDVGYEYAKLGLAINERLDDLTLRARVIYVYAMFVHHWSNHWASLTPWFHKGIEAGYQSGDLLYLAYSAQDCVIWDPTLDLETAHRLHSKNLEIVRECAYQDSLDSGTLFLQLHRNLLGLTDGLCSLSDSEFDEYQCLEGMRERQFMTGIANYHIYRAEICFLYGEYQQALVHIRDQDQLTKSVMSLPQLVRFYITAFLTLCTHYPEMDRTEQQQTRDRLETNLARMTLWANNCEANFRHLQYLMQAELRRIDNHSYSAMDCYDQAIDSAKASGFLRDEAMANERAGRYLLSLNKKRAAEGYIRAAHDIYARWGAYRKVKLLEQEFPLLSELPTSTNTVINDQTTDVDLASVMKASRVISGEIILEQLLKTIMSILLENAGGQWGCFVIKKGEEIQVESIIHPNNQIMTTAGLPKHSLIPTHNNNFQPLPITLISEVFHSRKAIVLNDAAHEGEFIQDPYIIQFQPKSVFCIPILREHFEGAVYMENNLADNVFSKDRVELIRLLAAQAAVAIENAKLYEQVQEYSKTLEDKVAERTARLEQLNLELQDLADCDGLTGVANRRRGDGYLSEVWPRLRRDNKPLSIIMLDVDHFKNFNDNYGHQSGDDCLIKVAKTINNQLLRPSDLIARYGGEEFIIILPDTDKIGAGQVAEKIRSAVEALNIPHGFTSSGSVVTISAGTATRIPAPEESIESLLHEADNALYQAKRSGRNKVFQAANNA